MSHFDQPRIPQNLVVDIIGEKIYMEHMSSQMIDTIKGLGAFQRPVGAELIWTIQCTNRDELTKILQELNRLGFLFTGSPSGWPAADVFAELLEKRKLRDKFKEIRWRSPDHWFIIER